MNTPKDSGDDNNTSGGGFSYRIGHNKFFKACKYNYKIQKTQNYILSELELEQLIAQ